MSNENTNKDQETTQAGQEQRSLEDRVDALGKSVFKMSMTHGNALDMIYIQMITLIEILSDEGLLTPEKWEAKLETVSKSMEETIKEKMNDKTGNSGQDNGENPDGANASEGSGKIITPNSGIIIP
jgi:hypothetical protein